MRVLIDGRPAYRGITGIPRYTRLLLRALPLLSPRFHCKVFTWRTQLDDTRTLLAPGIPCVASPLPGRALAGLSQTGIGVPRLGLGRFQIFHATSFDAIEFRGCKTIVTIYDLAYVHARTTYAEEAARGFEGCVERALRRGYHVLTLTQHARRDLMTAYGFADEAISVIPAFLDDGVTGFGASRHMTGPRVQPYVLFVGEIGPRKNLAAVIHAFALIARDFPHDLVLAGPCGKDTGYPAYLASLALDKGIAERVKIIGEQDTEELRRLYAQCAAFVFVSLHEGFGFPPLEAMSWGRPVVASNTSCLPEVLGDAAVLVDPTSIESIAAELALILTSDRLAAVIGRAGQLHAARYAFVEPFIQRLEDLYDRLLR